MNGSAPRYPQERTASMRIRIPIGILAPGPRAHNPANRSFRAPRQPSLSSWCPRAATGRAPPAAAEPRRRAHSGLSAPSRNPDYSKVMGYREGDRGRMPKNVRHPGRVWRSWGKSTKSNRMTRTLHLPFEPGETLLCASNCNSSSATMTSTKGIFAYPPEKVYSRDYVFFSDSEFHRHQESCNDTTRRQSTGLSLSLDRGSSGEP